MAVHYLGDNGPDGICMGTAATVEKIGFYGATPIVKQTVVAPNPSATTGTNEAAIVAINTALVNLGLIVTS